jgi:sulfatase modifying factor 1
MFGRRLRVREGRRAVASGGDPSRLLAGTHRGVYTAVQRPRGRASPDDCVRNRTAGGGRLPAEAEWEYAARAGTSTRYYDSLPAIAWFSGNTEEAPRPVAGRKPNAFGLYDMLGNVSEWVLDRYYNAYDDTGDPDTVEQPLAGNAFGVARGGSWVSDPSGVRVSRRLEMVPDAEEPHIGFRCAADRL